nr:hypothetical protein PJ912_01565 [Pectobacterium colocasium]
MAAPPAKIKTVSVLARWASATSTTVPSLRCRTAASASALADWVHRILLKNAVQNLAANGLGADGSDGNASGTTYAAVSPGSLIIRDQANQQQDVSELSRDVEHANQSISPIFDKAKEQQRLSQLRLIGDVVNQGVNITLTQGQIMANSAGLKLRVSGIRRKRRAKSTGTACRILRLIKISASSIRQVATWKKVSAQRQPPLQRWQAAIQSKHWHRALRLTWRV